MAKGNKDVKRGIVLYLDGKEVENNARSIQREMRQVQKEINGCTIGSKEYVEATKRYKQLNAILQEHRNNLREVKTEHFSFINTVNNLWQKWNVTIGAFLAAFTGVSLALSKFRKEMNADEESAANLKALTGLDDNSIQWLESQARELSTTMDESGLRIQKSTKEILEAYMLVGSAKPELLQNKEALNAVTIEALRLAEAAKMDMKSAVDGVTLALNQYGASADEASRYVNVLAAGSKFGAAGVQSQTAAIVKAGVAASTAKVPIESLVGSIETLAEKGIKDEVAGTGLKTFFLKLEGMADDVRPSVVGLETALENLRNKNLSTAETQKMFGLEAFTVAKAMIDGADKVREYTAAVTDTNTAFEQAAINSDTANAKLAQMKNEFNEQGKILVKELNPAITKIIGLGMNSTRMLVNITMFLTQYRTTLALTSVAIGLYITWQKRKIIIDQLEKFWNDQLTVSYTRLRAAIASNPWGIALVAITAVLSALIDFNSQLGVSFGKIGAIKKLNQETAEEYDKVSSKVEILNRMVHNENLALDDRKKALNELKEIVPGYLADLTEEGKLVKDNTEAIKKWLVEKEKEIRLKAAQEDLEEIVRKQRKKEKERLEAEKELEAAKAKMGSPSSSSTPGYGPNVSGLIADKDYLDAKRKLKSIDSDLKDLDKDYKDIQSEIEKGGLVPKTKNTESPAEPTITPTGDGSGSGGSGSTSGNPEADRIKKETEAIELEFSQRRNILRQDYIEEKKSRAEYNNDLVALEYERITRLLQIAGLEPSKIAELQGRLQDIVMKAKDDLDGIGLVESVSEELDAYDKELERINQQYNESIAKLKQAHDLGILDEEQFQERMAVLMNNYATDAERANTRYQEALKKANKDSAEELHGFEKVFADSGVKLRDLSEDIGASIGEGITAALMNEKDALRSALHSLLTTLLDAIEKMLIAATVESELLTLTGLGTANGLLNLAKLVGIKAAFAGLKATVNKFDVGGYTGNGGPYEPAGIVHKGEFVANRFALANPAVKSVLDVIDRAQRAGNVANLSSDDLRSVGASSAPSTRETNDAMTLSMIQVIRDCTAMLATVKERFDKPIVAETYATGKHGTMEAERNVEQMISNATRHA